MKKTTKYQKIIAIITLVILLISSIPFGSTAALEITPTEAAELALFYYCLNAPNNDLITLDDYVVTPLYDNNGSVTYYCVDFFNEGIGKGYVVIGENLNYLQCTELCHEGNSSFYLLSLEDKETIYFNPFEVYTIDDNNVCTDIENQVVSLDAINGSVIDGEIGQNSQVLNITSTTFPEDDLVPFSEHPLVYLSGKGFTNTTASTTFGTIETAMTNAGCFVPMYDLSEESKYFNYNGRELSNQGHCAITAITNILMFWRTRGCPAYPASYDDLFATVLDVAADDYYFDTEDPILDWFESGLNPAYVDNVMLDTNARFSYYGQVQPNTEASWDFLKHYINSQWPIYFRVSHNSNNQSWITPNHAYIIFGYNSGNGTYEGNYYTYNFAKIYDVRPYYQGSGKFYVCWDAIVSQTLFNSNFTSTMYAFCPYMT